MVRVAPNESPSCVGYGVEIPVRKLTPPPRILGDNRVGQPHGVAQDMVFDLLKISAERLGREPDEPMNGRQGLVRRFYDVLVMDGDLGFEAFQDPRDVGVPIEPLPGGKGRIPAMVLHVREHDAAQILHQMDGGNVEFANST